MHKSQSAGRYPWDSQILSLYMGPKTLVSTWAPKHWSQYMLPKYVGAMHGSQNVGRYAWVPNTVVDTHRPLVAMHGSQKIGRYTWAPKRWSLCMGPKTRSSTHMGPKTIRKCSYDKHITPKNTFRGPRLVEQPRQKIKSSRHDRTTTRGKPIHLHYFSYCFPLSPRLHFSSWISSIFHLTMHIWAILFAYMGYIVMILP